MQLYGSEEKSVLMQFNRTHNIEDVKSDMKGQEVIIGGWIEDLRKLGKMTFLTVRDVTGLSQVIVKEESSKISQEGLITNKTNLLFGIYHLEIRVNDTSGNEISVKLNIKILEYEKNDSPTDSIPGYSSKILILVVVVTLLIQIKKKKEQCH